MATVNRTSLRDALEELKARSAALHEAPEPELAEYRALVADQNALLELIATVLLEKLTPRSSRNSSIPPSQTDGDGDPTSRSRNRKKREEVPESPASTRTREEHHVHEAHACKHCGEKLTGTEATDHERRTRIDVVFEKVVEHHDAEIRHCPHCHGETRAAFPDDLHGPRQYGVGIRVFAVHQLMQMVPLRRTVQSLSAMIGEKLSEATLPGFLTRVHKALAGREVLTPPVRIRWLMQAYRGVGLPFFPLLTSQAIGTTLIPWSRVSGGGTVTSGRRRQRGCGSR